MKFNFKKVRNGESCLEYFVGYLPSFIRDALYRSHRISIWKSTLTEHGLYEEVFAEINNQRKSKSMEWHVQDLLNWLDKNPEYKHFIISEK